MRRVPVHVGVAKSGMSVPPRRLAARHPRGPAGPGPGPCWNPGRGSAAALIHAVARRRAIDAVRREAAARCLDVKLATVKSRKRDGLMRLRWAAERLALG